MTDIRQHPVYQLIAQAFRPPERLDSISWCEKHLYLPKSETANAGPWRVAATPFWRHWHNIVSARSLGPTFVGKRDPYAHLTEQIWIVKGRQVGGTISFLLACLSYLAATNPGPMGFFLPKKEHLKKFSKGRWLKLFEHSPELQAHMPQTTLGLREQITQHQWILDTMTVLFKCSAIADELRSDPLRWEGFDEFDLTPMDVDGKVDDEDTGEGDAIDVALNAMKTFAGLAMGVTTPTLVEHPGWLRLNSGSHERLFITCEGCGADVVLSDCEMVIEHQDYTDPLTMAEAVASDISHESVKVRDLARLQCPHCGNTMTTRERDRVVRAAGDACRWVPGEWELNENHPQGHWTPWAEFGDNHALTTIHPPETYIRTGWLPTHYSRKVSLGSFAAEEMRIRRRGRPGEIKAFRNNWHALPTIPAAVGSGEKPDETRERLVISYPAKVIPTGVRRIITTADQQGDELTKLWFPYVTRGYGLNGESWLIDEGAVKGFEGLDRLDDTKWPGPNGDLRSDITGVDGANGDMSVYLQQWVQKRAGRRVIVHGRGSLVSGPWQQRVERQQKKSNRRKLLRNVRYFYCRTNTFKTMLASRINQQEGDDNPPFHLHNTVSDRYLASLGSEHQQPKKNRQGLIEMRWVPRTTFTEHGEEVERDDTHWWDAEWMNLALSIIFEWDHLTDETKKSKRTYGVVGQVGAPDIRN